MLNKIEDIKKALGAQAYLSALALTLTLPDICGKAKYPNEKSTKVRYVNWYDEYVTPYTTPEGIEDIPKLDGKRCYALRCAFLHEGSAQANIKGKKNEPDDTIDNFVLQITRNSGLEVGVSSFGVSSANGGTESTSIRLDITQFCFWLYEAASDFYDENKDILDFTDARITLFDFNKEVEKNRNR